MIELKLKNYRRFLEDPNTNDGFHQLSFAPGLTIITGLNGSGKTTLVEALGYGLYGTKLAKKQEIIPDNAEGTEVVVTLEIDEQTVKVTRYGSRAKLEVNGALQVEDLPGSVSEVNRRLSTLLGGLTPKQFKHTYFAQQGDTSGLVDTTSTSRQQTIAQILQLDVLQKAVEIQKKRQENGLQQVQTQGRAISDAEEFQFGAEKRRLLDGLARFGDQKRAEHISLFQSRVVSVVSNYYENAQEKDRVLTELKDKVEEIGEEIGEIEAACKQVKSKVTKHERLMGEHNKIENEINILLALQGRAQDEVNKLVEQIEHAEACKDTANEHKLLLGQSKTYNQRLHRLPLVKERYDALRKACRQREGLERELEKLKTVDQQLITAKRDEATKRGKWEQLETDPTERDRQAWQERKASLDNREKEIKTALETLQETTEDAYCPTCNHPLSQHRRRERLEHLNKWVGQELPQQRAKLQQEKADLDRRQKAWQRSKTDARQAWKQAHEAVTEAQRQLYKRDELLRQYNAALEAVKVAQQAWDVLGETEEYDSAEKQQLREQIAELEEQANELKKDAELYHRLPEMREVLRDKKNEIEGYTEKITEHQQHQSEVGYDSTAYSRAKEELTDIEEKHSKIQGQLNEANLEKERCQATVDQAQKAAKEAERMQNQLVEDVLQFQREDQLLMLLSNFHDHFFKANTEQVSQRASELILYAVEDGSILGIEFDEKGILYYLDASNHRRQVTDTRPSGGEKALIGLCLRIALAEQAQSIARIGKLRFLVLDEVLSSLDDERREVVQRIFEDVQQRSVFDHIIMITHLDAVKQQWRAPRLEIEKVGTKTSRIK